MPDIVTQIGGIDASKNQLDLTIHGHTKVTRVPNTVAGWKTLATSLVAAGVTRVGIEVTGGYERGVMGYLRDQGGRRHPAGARAGEGFRHAAPAAGKD
jgi:transposase